MRYTPFLDYAFCSGLSISSLVLPSTESRTAPAGLAEIFGWDLFELAAPITYGIEEPISIARLVNAPHHLSRISGLE